MADATMDAPVTAAALRAEAHAVHQELAALRAKAQQGGLTYDEGLRELVFERHLERLAPRLETAQRQERLAQSKLDVETSVDRFNATVPDKKATGHAVHEAFLDLIRKIRAHQAVHQTQEQILTADFPPDVRARMDFPSKEAMVEQLAANLGGNGVFKTALTHLITYPPTEAQLVEGDKGQRPLNPRLVQRYREEEVLWNARS